MRVLVTGGAGYIGSHTVKALIEAKHQPVVLDNLVYGNRYAVEKFSDIPLIVGNVGNKKLIKNIIFGRHESLVGSIHEGKMIEGILHFAAYSYIGESIKYPLKYYKNNVGESINLLDVICSEEVIKKRKSYDPIPLVFSSSCATYGIPKELPIIENTPQHPINPYGKSKLMIENMIKDLALYSNLKSVILRYFNAAGASPDSSIGEEHTSETHLIPSVIKAALKSKQISIFGDNYSTKDGTCIRDYIHVCDLADAHVLAINYLENEVLKAKKDSFHQDFCKVYNLGNGVGFSVKEILSITERITKTKINSLITSKRIGDPAVLIASADKIIKELGWKPKYPSIEDIVKHAYLWHKKNL
tara:strand:- start:97 stop:1170 length:1074 start_codon:yes stop_codon:yes gene_type:complete